MLIFMKILNFMSYCLVPRYMTLFWKLILPSIGYRIIDLLPRAKVHDLVLEVDFTINRLQNY